MKIRRVAQHETISTITAKKGTITSDRMEGTMIWQEEESQIYITCPACNNINNISNHPVGPKGVVSPCVVCSNCQTHFFPVLEKWDGRVTVQCVHCEKIIRTFKDPFKEGWVYTTANCECCRIIVCPKCSKK